MKICYIMAAALTVWSIPAVASEGHSGYFNIRVTEGSYTLYNQMSGEYDTYSLVGQSVTMRWNSIVRYNVPSPFQPSMNVAKLIRNSASINTPGFGFSSETTNDPFQDQGSARIGASYNGNADMGSFGVAYNCNSCPDHSVSFSFTTGLTDARGTGRASLVDDGRYDYFGQIKFDITGGRAFAAVPEPASWALMLGGFVSVGAVLRRPRSVSSKATSTSI
jgi:hypothetical protein